MPAASPKNGSRPRSSWPSRPTSTSRWSSGGTRRTTFRFTRSSLTESLSTERSGALSEPEKPEQQSPVHFYFYFLRNLCIPRKSLYYHSLTFFNCLNCKVKYLLLAKLLCFSSIHFIFFLRTLCTPRKKVGHCKHSLNSAKFNTLLFF